MANSSPYQPFQQLLQELKKQSEEIDKYLEGGSDGRPWMIPPKRGWDGDPLKITDMKKPFDRPDPNEEYIQELHAAESATAIAMGKKVQIDYMGMQERSFRARNSTSIRAAMHASGRRKGHGEESGIHIGLVLQYVQDLLKAGGGSQA